MAIGKNVVNFDFQGVVDMFIHDISGDWPQIMSKLDLPLKSATRVLILIENTKIFAIYDWSEIITWSVTGHTNL